MTQGRSWGAATGTTRSRYRDPFQHVLAEPDPYRAGTLMVDHLADLWRRYAPIREVMRGAASSGEPALRDL